MSVDIHAHVIPSVLQARAAERGGLFGIHLDNGSLVHPEGFRVQIAEDFHDPATILDRMDAAGLRTSWLSLAPTMFHYGLPSEPAGSFAAMANDALAEMVGSSERLGGLAHLPMQDPSAAAEELERTVTRLDFRGALIGTNVGERTLDEPDFAPIFATAERLDVPLVLHPYFTGPKARLEPYFFTNTIGNPFETALAAARLIFSGTLDRFPRLKVVLVHGAGYLPYQVGRLDHAHRVRAEAAVDIAAPPSTYLRRFWVDTVTHSDAALEFAVGIFGSDRIVVGTDLPFDMADRAPLDRAARAGVPADVLRATAEALVGRPSVAARRPIGDHGEVG
jgi:aminocarboxymuconate-semialdehyde decarboxylase